MELALTVMFPLAPEVPETRLRREPVASVSTLAVTPAFEALMAAARPESVSFDEFSVTVCAVPLPTCKVIEPARVSEALVISARYPLEVWARLLTNTVWVPAAADEVAAVSSSTFSLELEPVLLSQNSLKIGELAQVVGEIRKQRAKIRDDGVLAFKSRQLVLPWSLDVLKVRHDLRHR